MSNKINYNPNAIHIIFESAPIWLSKKKDNLVIVESYTKGFKKGKIVMRAMLQESDSINQNKRIYPKRICEEIVSTLSKKTPNALLQEMDHPMDDGPNKLQRAGSIKLTEICSKIRKINMQGGKVIAEVETLQTPKGEIMASLINDSVDIGFSLRMLGKVKPYSKDPSIMEVCNPINPITYDVVHNPSHKNAKIMSIMNEGVEIGIFDSNSDLLTESTTSERFIEDMGFRDKYLLTEDIDPSVFDSGEIRKKELTDFIINDIYNRIGKLPLLKNFYN